jgi:basic membrane protein A
MLLVVVLGISLVGIIGLGKGKIGIVLDTGGLGDLSFNDAAYAGVVQAVADFGFDGIVFVESETAADYLPNLRAQARMDDVDLIIGVGWLLTESIELVAAEYPDKLFANVDGWVPGAPNVRGFMFKEGDGSAIIGALAAFQALELGFDSVGVIFGFEGPVMYHFEAGYRVGIDWALEKYQAEKGLAEKPNLKLLAPYSGSFSDPAIGKQIMESQIGEGVVGSYNVSGGVGIGMMQAVASAHANAGTITGAPYYFGVDQNQDWWELGQFCPMSMLKRVDSATYNACKMVAEGTWEAGRSLLGIAEVGVYVSDTADLSREIEKQIIQGGIDAADQYTILANWAANRAGIDAWIWAALDELEAGIVDGSIEVPFIDTLTDIEALRAQYPLN